VGSRTLSRVINVPATPVKALPVDRYALISFPFAFDPQITNNGDASTIINGLTAQKEDQLLLQRFDPVAYYETGGDPYPFARQLAPGLGYFYKRRISSPVFLNGAVPVPEQAPLPSGSNPTAQATPYQLTLSRGWNLIGNPYVYNIPLAFLRIVPLDNNPTLRSFSFAQAVAAGYVRGAVFYLPTSGPKAGTYDFLQNLGDPLRPWEGYWLFASSRVNLIFSAPTTIDTAVLGATPTSATGRGAVTTGRALVKNPTTDEWKLQLVARGEGGVLDEATLVGVSRAASDGDDIRDLPKPPPFRDYVYMAIEREGASTRFAQDLKTPGGTRSWDLAVSTDRDGPVTLFWPNTAALPKRLRLRLTDLASGRAVDLRSASSLTVPGSRGATLRYRLTAETGPSRPLAIANVHARPTRAGANYTVSFSLTSDAVVAGEIRTLGNKLVRSLGGGRSASVGENELHWDGRNQNGDALPAGPYMVQITARGDDGKVVKQKVPLLKLK
jgi:hypothetical protein